MGIDSVLISLQNPNIPVKDILADLMLDDNTRVIVDEIRREYYGQVFSEAVITLRVLDT